MQDTIWKFAITPGDVIEIGMPKGAKILSVGVQYEAVHVWALVDPSAQTVQRSLRMVGTGHPGGDLYRWKLVGMVMLRGGALVFHLFDCGEL